MGCFGESDLIRKTGAVGLVAAQPLSEGFVIDFHGPLLDQLQQAIDRGLDPGEFGLEPPHVLAAFLLRGAATIEVGREQLVQAIRREDAVGERIEHHTVELVHHNGATIALPGSPEGAPRTCVVAIPAELPGPKRHAGPTGGTSRESCQQDGAGQNARWILLRVALREHGLDPFEQAWLDDGWDVHRDPFRAGAHLPRLCFPDVEVMGAGVGLVGQDAMHARDVEVLATETHALGV